jgi:hypothetical protein
MLVNVLSNAPAPMSYWIMECNLDGWKCANEFLSVELTVEIGTFYLISVKH